MLTARGTLGIALTLGPDCEEALLRRAAEAGAGGLRIAGSAAAGEALDRLRALGFEVVAAWPAARLVGEEPPHPPDNEERFGAPRYRGGGGAILELEAATDEDRAALPAALERVGESLVLLGLGRVSPVDRPSPAAPPDLPGERVTALALTVEGSAETADPKRMEEALRAAAGPLRAAGWRQPFWLTELAAPGGAAAEAAAGWLVRHAAHALALAMPRVFLRLPEPEPEAALRALAMLAAWLEGAERVTWLARGQYRAEFVGRPNRYLLWAETGITRLPSSFQGPLHARDLAGEERRVETSHLRLSDIPLLVERRSV